MHKATLIAGDGIGPSITDVTVRVIEASGIKIEWDRVDAGLAAIDKYKDPLPPHVIESIKNTKIALKGPLTTPVGSGFRSVNVALRKEFDLYANVRPTKTFDGVSSRYKDIDLVVIRENTEGLYTGIEHFIGANEDIAEMVGIVTRTGSQRVAEYAFEFARKQGRKKVTIVHKANILKYTQGLFLKVAHEVAARYPDIEVSDRIIDNTAMQLVLNPHQFDVIVTTNLFGDILSDLASGLAGGLGLAPGANIGFDTAIFEAVHGSAPDIAGKNIANPCALILAAVTMLRHIGEVEAARKIENGVSDVLKEGKSVTADLKKEGAVGTNEMGDAIIAKL